MSQDVFKGDKSVKGYLFNLIVYVHDKSRSEYFQKIIQPFIEKYPCKAIFIESSANDASEHLQTSAEFDDSLNGKCDQFAIDVSDTLLHKVPFVVLPQLIPDLPTYLVWGHDPASDNEILPNLQKLATRFVFDAECARDLRMFSHKMLEKIDRLNIEFMDVSWSYISGWRDAIAETFNSPKKLDYLRSCSEIVIKYNTIEAGLLQHPAVQAIYLQGWLAAQLGWQFESLEYDREMQLTYKSDGSLVKITLQPQDRPTLERGRVFEMEIQDSNELKTTMTLAEKQSKIMVYVSTPEKCELPFSHSVPDLAKGLTAMKEVFYYQCSEHYSNTLAVLKEIPWKEF